MSIVPHYSLLRCLVTLPCHLGEPMNHAEQGSSVSYGKGKLAMVFSTPASNSAFKAAFTVPATALLSPPLECASSKDLYTQLGKLWGAGHRAVQSLDGSDRHVPAADSSLKDDVAGEVETILDGL